MKLSIRSLFLALFMAVFGMIGVGLYLQHVRHLEPCAMCILQRYAFLMVGLVSVAAFIQGPGRAGVRIYASLVLLCSLLGGAVAARQAWMQRFPVRETECGPGLDYMLQSFPLADALPMIFSGGGDCSKIQWTFLGGTIPEWALVFFVMFALAALHIIRRAGLQGR